MLIFTVINQEQLRDFRDACVWEVLQGTDKGLWRARVGAYHKLVGGRSREEAVLHCLRCMYGERYSRVGAIRAPGSLSVVWEPGQISDEEIEQISQMITRLEG